MAKKYPSKEELRKRAKGRIQDFRPRIYPSLEAARQDQPPQPPKRSKSS